MAAIYSEHPAMFRDDPGKFVVALVLVPVFGIGLVIFVWWWLECITTTLSIEGDQVRYSTGIFSKTKIGIEGRRIRSVRVHQSFVQRITGVGDILIFTAGDVPEITAHGVRNPDEVRDLIDQIDSVSAP